MKVSNMATQWRKERIAWRTHAPVTLFFLCLLAWQWLTLGANHPITTSIQTMTAGDPIGTFALWAWVWLAAAAIVGGLVISLSFRFYSWTRHSVAVLRVVAIAWMIADLVGVIALTVALGDAALPELAATHTGMSRVQQFSTLFSFGLGTLFLLQLLVQAPSALIARAQNTTYLVSLMNIRPQWVVLTILVTGGITFAAFVLAVPMNTMLSIPFIATGIYALVYTWIDYRLFGRIEHFVPTRE